MNTYQHSVYGRDGNHPYPQKHPEIFREKDIRPKRNPFPTGSGKKGSITGNGRYGLGSESVIDSKRIGVMADF